ncbi:MAG: hypothetical protein QG645_427 [Patescibacteria group bacterium]|nr:hypothetical protein [Patescibacteria group bacterium]
MKTNKVNNNKSWIIASVGSAIGLIASFIQTIERISYADQPLKALTCDINSIFSCSSVFDGWQSSFFGFSNSIMSLTFFAVVFGVSISGATGSIINKYLRYVMHFFSVFFLAFGAWYLHQTVYAIGALCIFCIFIYSGVILLNWAFLRININDLVKSPQLNTKFHKLMVSGADTFLWVLWALIMFIVLANQYI